MDGWKLEGDFPFGAGPIAGRVTIRQTMEKRAAKRAKMYAGSWWSRPYERILD